MVSGIRLLPLRAKALPEVVRAHTTLSALSLHSITRPLFPEPPSPRPDSPGATGPQLWREAGLLKKDIPFSSRPSSPLSPQPPQPLPSLLGPEGEQSSGSVLPVLF